MKKVTFNHTITIIDEPVELALALKLSRISDLLMQKALQARFDRLLSPIFTESHRKRVRSYIQLQNGYITK